VVCGPSMGFFDIVVRWPGSYHDSYIFSGSYANQYFADSTHNVILLGDGGMYFYVVVRFSNVWCNALISEFLFYIKLF